MCVCVYIYIYIYICVCVCVYIYIYIYIHIYIYIYIFVIHLLILSFKYFRGLSSYAQGSVPHFSLHVSGAPSGVIQVYNVSSGELTREFSIHTSAIK